MIPLVLGSAHLGEHALKDSGGADLNTDNIASGFVELVQYGKLKATLVFGVAPAALRPGAAKKSIVRELTAAQCAELERGPLRERYTLVFNDNRYATSGNVAPFKWEVEEIEIV